jgi:hypothetical protein
LCHFPNQIETPRVDNDNKQEEDIKEEDIKEAEMPRLVPAALPPVLLPSLPSPEPVDIVYYLGPDHPRVRAGPLLPELLDEDQIDEELMMERNGGRTGTGFVLQPRRVRRRLLLELLPGLVAGDEVEEEDYYTEEDMDDYDDNDDETAAFGTSSLDLRQLLPPPVVRRQPPPPAFFAPSTSSPPTLMFQRTMAMIGDESPSLSEEAAVTTAAALVRSSSDDEDELTRTAVQGDNHAVSKNVNSSHPHNSATNDENENDDSWSPLVSLDDGDATAAAFHMVVAAPRPRWPTARIIADNDNDDNDNNKYCYDGDDIDFGPRLPEHSFGSNRGAAPSSPRFHPPRLVMQSKLKSVRGVFPTLFNPQENS